MTKLRASARRPSQLPRSVMFGAYLALAAGAAIQVFHSGAPELFPLNPIVHWLRDGLAAVPVGIIAVALTVDPVRRIASRFEMSATATRYVWALVAALAYAMAIVPGNFVHDRLFSAVSDHHTASWSHAISDAIAVVDPALVALVLAVAMFGAPWEVTPARMVGAGAGRLRSIRRHA